MGHVAGRPLACTTSLASLEAARPLTPEGPGSRWPSATGGGILLLPPSSSPARRATFPRAKHSELAVKISGGLNLSLGLPGGQPRAGPQFR